MPAASHKRDCGSRRTGSRLLGWLPHRTRIHDPSAPANAPIHLTRSAGARLGASARRLLTAEDLADRWQVPKSHVYRLTREGVIPAVRLGRYYRYKLEAIEAFERNGDGSA